jgi:diacylglycerol kinase
MFNSALEALARAVTDQENPYVRDSLDVGSAAVLLASIGSTVIGGLIFGNRLVLMLEWW